MDQLPIYLTLTGRPVLLVGTGPAADAKARLLDAAGARVVSAIEPGVRIAFVALDEPAETAARLKAAGLLVNVVDRPELCDFTTPAIVDRSPLIVAIGTGGASAGLAKALRERIEALLPGSLGALARAVAASRPGVAARLTTPSERRGFWDALFAAGAPLDPLRDVADSAVVIAAALDGGAPTDDVVETVTLTSADPDDLTLRALRSLSRADTIVHDATVPPAILDRARRDAVRIVGTAPPSPPPPGRTVLLRVA